MKLIRENSILVSLITNVTTLFLSPEIGAVAEVFKTMGAFIQDRAFPVRDECLRVVKDIERRICHLAMSECLSKSVPVTCKERTEKYNYIHGALPH